MGFDRQIGYGLLSIRELWVLIRNRLGGPKILWVITDYGLSQVWVKTESTVLQIVDALPVRKKLPFFREVAGSSAISAGCSLSSPLSSAVSRAEELIARSSVSGADSSCEKPCSLPSPESINLRPCVSCAFAAFCPRIVIIWWSHRRECHGVIPMFFYY